MSLLSSAKIYIRQILDSVLLYVPYKWDRHPLYRRLSDQRPLDVHLIALMNALIALTFASPFAPISDAHPPPLDHHGIS